MRYPPVATESNTLGSALRGWSIARFGDGELNLCRGRSSVSQQWTPEIQRELRTIAAGYIPCVLTCIPNIAGRDRTPRAGFWTPFRTKEFTDFYSFSGTVRYGSSFITRPDNAPWIDRPEYWAEVRKLWANKNVAYVSGNGALFPFIKQDAARVDEFAAPLRDAYSALDELTRALLARPYDAVIIALGAAGTCLAARLGANGAQHALDLGHMGMFMENPGAFNFQPDDLASDSYRALLREAHERTHWGKGGYGWAERVADFARGLNATEVLDYGCGQGTLRPALKALGVKCLEYDPGIPGKDVLPKLADVVVSTDVFEHIEPEKVDAVLRHTFALARKGGFFAIAKQPAKKILADGRNAHLVCQSTEWWVERLRAAGWKDIKVKEDAWKKCLVLCRK